MSVTPPFIVLLLLCTATVAAAQPTDRSTVMASQPRNAEGQAAPEEKSVGPPWQYGGFSDVGFLRDFNEPVNKLFRSRGTAWHVDDWHLNMTGAYLKKRASEQSRWGSELLVHTGKDDEIFGFSATAP